MNLILEDCDIYTSSIFFLLIKITYLLMKTMVFQKLYFTEVKVMKKVLTISIGSIICGVLICILAACGAIHHINYIKEKEKDTFATIITRYGTEVVVLIDDGELKPVNGGVLSQCHRCHGYMTNNIYLHNDNVYCEECVEIVHEENCLVCNYNESWGVLLLFFSLFIK